MNKFADLNQDEFRKVMGLRPLPESKAPDASPERLAKLKLSDPPLHVDWRTAGKVNPVKDQGQCGSCWAFSAVGESETSIAIATGKLVDLSEQEVVSCDTKFDAGCAGGNMDDALDWIIKKGGIASTADYPYTSGKTGKDGKCQVVGDIAGSISAYEKIAKKDELSMISAAAVSALSVGIDASGIGFMLYNGGVFDDSKKECKPGARDHGVVVVGYEAGTQRPLEGGFWLMRNSWGEDWGEQGYMNVAMGVEGVEGVCGIAIEAILVDA
jgi:C1A family cysteine protease